MSQDPLKPLNDGKIGTPKITPGMNKLPPVPRPGGKDDKPNEMMGRSQSDDEKLLARVRKRFERCTQAEAMNRKDALDDLKFKTGDQWPADVAAQRNFDKRPCLTINKLPTFVHQITNDQRQNRPAINISPVGEKGDLEVAKMYRGLIRSIERQCSADIAYDTAFDGAVSNGFGYWRVVTEYETADSFDQTLVIKRIRNPFTVYMDPDCQDPTGADAKFCFITEMMPKSEFEDKWPDADPMNFELRGVGDGKLWIDADNIRVAEYFEIEMKTRVLVELDNGHVGWEDELSEFTKAQIKAGKVEVVNERESESRKVNWYTLNALEVLEEEDWLGSCIPVVRIIGDEVDVEGKVKLSGLIRYAKDAQRMVNYWATLKTELLALAPKAPWLVEEGQVEGYESMWKQANTKSYAYLPYKGTNVGGKPAPPPQRQQFAQVPAGIVQAEQGAAQDMMATTGIRFDATMNERMIDESGKAIKELRRSGDIGAFHYIDNLARGLRRTGEIFIELIPKIYNSKRMLTILREDDTEEHVQIDPRQTEPYKLVNREPTPDKPQGSKLKIFNPTYGKYGVTVTIGPSYATKRIEASESMMDFMKAIPSVSPLVADLVAKNQDWPGGQEFATRLAKVIAQQHPGVMTPDMKDVSPQLQALIQGMQAQIQQLSQERMQHLKLLDEKNTEHALQKDKIDKDFEAKVLAIMQKADAAAQKHIGDKVSKVGDQFEALTTEMQKPKPTGGRTGRAKA